MFLPRSVVYDILGTMLTSTQILHVVAPTFGHLAALEGEYGAGVRRVERASEEVACVRALPSIFHTCHFSFDANIGHMTESHVNGISSQEHARD